MTLYLFGQKPLNNIFTLRAIKTLQQRRHLRLAAHYAPPKQSPRSGLCLIGASVRGVWIRRSARPLVPISAAAFTQLLCVSNGFQTVFVRENLLASAGRRTAQPSPRLLCNAQRSARFVVPLCAHTFRMSQSDGGRPRPSLRGENGHGRRKAACGGSEKEIGRHPSLGLKLQQRFRGVCGLLGGGVSFFFNTSRLNCAT